MQEDFRQRVIAEARRKLLEQHEAQLRGFLPKVSYMTEICTVCLNTDVNCWY